MKQSIRVIVFNADEDYSATLRSELLSIPGVQIVAEVDEIPLIEQAVAQFPAEVLVVHLDPLPDLVLPTVAVVATGRPNLAVFVISENTDGRLILTVMRAGVREFLTKPISREQLAEAIGKVVANSEATAELGRVISVFGTVGGAGASVLTANLGVELAAIAENRPVAVVDMDFRYGQLGTMLDLQADYTIADLCDTPEQLDAGMIAKAMVKHSSGVHLLARPNQFSQADHITAAHCASVLSSLQHMYEYVVVDGPNRFDPGGLAILDLSQNVLMITQLLVTSVRNTHRMLDELRGGGYNLDRFALVCNRTGRDSAHLEISHVEETLKRKIAHQIPDDWKTVSAAINMGVPIREVNQKSKVRAAIRELAGRLANPQEDDETGEVNQGGLLSKIFN
jgi:pilus assembly protein CpaE